ncbi:hypothetical protein ACTHGU_18480 [Chitinophagaceae bacterium MMS25-I14]
MNIGAMREKLYDFIRVADEKKVKAIYMMLEDDITESAEWWEDAALMKELESRYTGWKNGSEKSFTMSDVKKRISDIKKRSLK